MKQMPDVSDRQKKEARNVKKKFRSWASLMLAVALVFTLIPPSVLSAAEGEYFHFTNMSTNESDPTLANKNTIDVNATFKGISEDTISYKVETKKGDSYVLTSDGSQIKPSITGPGSFSYPNVKLGEGLNRITVSGVSNVNGAAGLTASGTAYVKFSNVPAVTEVTLLDGNGRKLQAGEQAVVTTQTVSLMIQAANANRLTLKGVSVAPLSEGTFLVNDYRLSPGLNSLEFIATNDTMSYSITRELVYFNEYPNKGTAYNTKIGDISLDNNPTISPASGDDKITGVVSGKVVFKAPTGGESANPVIKVTHDGREYNTVTSHSTADGLTVVTYSTTAAVDISGASQNILISGVLYSPAGTPVDATIPFKFYKSDAPYITGVDQLYNVNEGGFSYGSAIPFSDNSSIAELPIWLKLNVNNRNGDPVKLTVKQTGKATKDIPLLNTPNSNDYVFKITDLNEGEQVFEFTAGDDKYSVAVKYIPSPFIELTDVYNGASYTGNLTDPADKRGSNPFKGITGRVVNFSPSDYSSVKIDVNGRSSNVTVDANGGFFIRNEDAQLVAGPNKIIFSGKSSGIPVTTTVTLYIFSEYVPIVKQITPLPFDTNTPNTEVFKPVEGSTDQYVTSANKMDVEFDVSNVSTLNIYLDGTSKRIIYAVLNPTTGNFEVRESEKREGSSAFYTLSSYRINGSANDYHLTLRTVDLLTPGVKSVTVEAIEGAAKVTKTMQVTREFAPYEILSPKLPDESVIKQNFLQVSIKAEGASQILLGKQEMVKGTEDIFRYELTNLKKGKNTVKFTVIRGTEKLNGQFVVNYTEEINIGAQYKAEISKTGKVKAFKDNLSISLPKGTLLQEPNKNPGQQAGQGELKGINMFDSQAVLFGIADPADGRTIKTFNDDGVIRTIEGTEVGRTILSPKAHYGYISNLYWVDSGYFVNDANSQGEQKYETVSGAHPYDMPRFYERNERWMEPSQRGTITLKYDSNIVNASAVNIGVWMYNPRNGDWINLGGKVDTNKKSITSTFYGFGYYVVMGMRYSYDDIISHGYARNEIEMAVSRGFMKAKDSAEFNAYESVTRGEFATMLVKLLDIPLDYPSPTEALTFQDVGRHYDYRWDYRYIETAVRKGIIRGKSPRVFMPGEALKREDAAVMIARAMNLKLGTYEKDLAALQKAFTDSGKIASRYSVPSVQAVTKAGIMKGIKNELLQGQKKATYRFDPTATFTRADAAVIAIEVAKKMKKL